MSGDINIAHIYGYIFSWGRGQWIGGRFIGAYHRSIAKHQVIYIAKAFITVISGGSAILAGTTSASVLLGGVNGIMSYVTGPTFGEVALLFTAIILLRLMPTGITGRFFRKSQ